MKPIESSHRIDTLDYLRGFALLGILLVNILSLLSVKVPAVNTEDAAYQRFLFLFVEGRFYPIFSFLFGVGFFLFISRARDKGNNGIVLFLRRVVVLFIFGLIHARFHPGDALTVYAVCGLILLPFYYVPKALNLLLGLLLLVMLSAVSVKVFMALPLVLLGIAAGQYRVFEKITWVQALIFTIAMLVLSAAALIFQYQAMPAAPFQFLSPLAFLKRGIMFGPIVSGFYTGLLVLLLQQKFSRKILTPLKMYGRMALTNYVLQTVLLLAAGYGWHWFGKLTYLESLGICLVIYAVQLTFSSLWLRFFRYGPLEWIWRLLTYGQVLSLRYNNR
jgi:uncharacterized membrane protein YeiB